MFPLYVLGRSNPAGCPAVSGGSTQAEEETGPAQRTLALVSQLFLFLHPFTPRFQNSLPNYTISCETQARVECLARAPLGRRRPPLEPRTPRRRLGPRVPPRGCLARRRALSAPRSQLLGPAQPSGAEQVSICI